MYIKKYAIFLIVLFFSCLDRDVSANDFLYGGCENIQKTDLMIFINNSIDWSRKNYLTYDNIKLLKNKELVYSQVNLKEHSEGYKIKIKNNEYLLYNYRYNYNHNSFLLSGIDLYIDNNLFARSWYSPKGVPIDYKSYFKLYDIYIKFNDLGNTKHFHVFFKNKKSTLYVFDDNKVITQCIVR